MGNSATKEQRSPPPYPRSHAGRSGSSHQSPTSPEFGPDGPQIIYSSRHGRGSRSEISTLFGIPNSHDRDGVVVETRRETKAEREARRLERERKTREIERERSMREESIDGGYLVTQGVYTGIEDYNKAVVRQLMIERRIAPFWRGLNDHEDSWTEHQLVAAARGLPIPAADEIPESPPSVAADGPAKEGTEPQSNNHLAVPIPGRSSASHSDNTLGVPSLTQNSSLPNSASPSSGSALLRGRAKTLASLTTSSRNVSQSDLQPREINLPRDPHVNGQPIEAYLYKDASECPICFLYYPPYLNRTRCCDQPICTECFVQIKRPDPHPPEHADPSQPQAEEAAAQDPDSLVSEPAACPYCVQPEFGVTFEQLPFKRGLAYANQGIGGAIDRSTPSMSSSSSLASLPQSGQLSPRPTAGRKRGSSLSASSPQVVTTDRIRPDWASKLANARAHAARRSAAATALHTAAYLMGGRNGQGEQNMPRFGRRTLLRRGGSDSPSGGSPSHMGMLGMMSERYGVQGREDSEGNHSGGERSELASPTISGPPRQSSRRTRVEDLEEMMMMEAIRLSLASEEERRRKEEKEAKKEAKRKEKEDKKAEKAAKKSGTSFYPSSANHSGITLGSPSSASLNTDPSSAGKGKAVAREAGEGSQSESAQQHLERSRAQILPSPTTPTAGSSTSASGSTSTSTDPAHLSSSYRPSHLRTLSTASSSDGSHTRADSPEHPSKLTLGPRDGDGNDSLSGSVPATPPISATPPGGGAGMEPMFNFRSLTAMVEREGVPIMEHEIVESDREKEDGEGSAKVGGKGEPSGEKNENVREGGSDGNPLEVRGKGDEATAGDVQKEKETEPQSPDEFVDAPSHPEASHGGDLGKAHEVSIQSKEERMEQGSV